MKYFFSGISILIVAILLNGLTKSIGIVGWYDYLSGTPVTNIFNWIYLLILYPLALGIASYLPHKLIKK